MLVTCTEKRWRQMVYSGIEVRLIVIADRWCIRWRQWNGWFGKLVLVNDWTASGTGWKRSTLYWSKLVWMCFGGCDSSGICRVGTT